MEYFYHRFARYSELPIVPELFQNQQRQRLLARDGDSTGAFQFNIVFQIVNVQCDAVFMVWRKGAGNTITPAVYGAVSVVNTSAFCSRCLNDSQSVGITKTVITERQSAAM